MTIAVGSDHARFELKRAPATPRADAGGRHQRRRDEMAEFEGATTREETP